MRRTGLLALIVGLLFSAGVAHADYLYTVSENDPFYMTPTTFSFIEPTLMPTGDVTTGIHIISGGTATEFSWNVAPSSLCPLVTDGIGGLGVTGFGCAAISEGTGGYLGPNVGGGFTPGAFLVPGTYDSIGGDVITVTITSTVDGRAPVPEPSTTMLLGSGLAGLAGITRRRLSGRS